MELTPWEELKAYVGFSDDDAEALTRLAKVARPRFGAITDRFYETLARFPQAAAVIEDTAQVERLKGTLRMWMAQLLDGPHDEEYAERRRRIGAVHVRVGLPERYVFAAMNLIRQDLVRLVFANFPSDQIERTCAAVSRVTDLELAIITSAYREAHEAVELRTLQDVIIRNMPVTVLCLDGEGRVTAATHPAARLFATGEVGRHYEEFLPNALIESADLPTRIGRALATGHSVSVPHVIVGRGDEARHYRITVVPLAHEMASILLHVEELTDVVLAEARAQQAEALARIGRLSAHVAHEIRNPLAAISATLQVIGGSFPEDDRRRGIVVRVQEQVLRLDRLVQNLLGYSRPAEARLAVIDLRECAREALSQSGVDGTLVAPARILALGDTQYVQQILVNLLQNARDASGRPVEIRVQPEAEVLVLDRGSGIDACVAGKLFEPFVTSKTRGTGLGLAISRKYAEAMSGRLYLCEEGATLSDGQRAGAAFCLALRAAAPERAPTV